MGFSAQGFALESRLSLDGSFGEEVQEELVRLVALAACGFKQAVQDAVVFQALIGASALGTRTHLAHLLYWAGRKGGRRRGATMG